MGWRRRREGEGVRACVCVYCSLFLVRSLGMRRRLLFLSVVRCVYVSVVSLMWVSTSMMLLMLSVHSNGDHTQDHSGVWLSSFFFPLTCTDFNVSEPAHVITITTSVHWFSFFVVFFPPNSSVATKLLYRAAIILLYVGVCLVFLVFFCHVIIFTPFFSLDHGITSVGEGRRKYVRGNDVN